MQKFTGILISFRCSFGEIGSFPKQQMVTAQATIDAVVDDDLDIVRLGAVKQVMFVDLRNDFLFQQMQLRSCV